MAAPVATCNSIIEFAGEKLAIISSRFESLALPFRAGYELMLSGAVTPGGKRLRACVEVDERIALTYYAGSVDAFQGVRDAEDGLFNELIDSALPLGELLC